MIDKLMTTIIRAINVHTAVKGMHLVLNCIANITPETFTTEEYNEALEKLIELGEIIEVKYTVPGLDVQKIYFIRGTTFDKGIDSND